jgi:hypothetical protein
MAEMGRMEMAMPDNTLPMMTGFGQFGPIEMGGMFTVMKMVMKIRADLAADDYRDPGPYRHPEGTVAYEFQGRPDLPPRSENPVPGAPAVERAAVKPGGTRTTRPRR